MSIRRCQLKNRKLGKISFHPPYIPASRCEGGWHNTPYIHRYTELFYVSSGKGNFLVNGDVFDVKAGGPIVVSPNVPHTEVNRDEPPSEYIVLGIEGLQFISFTNYMEYEDYNVHNHYEFRHEIPFYLKTLVQEMAQWDDDYGVAYQNLLGMLITNVVCKTRANLVVAPPQKITKGCYFVEQYADNHYQEDVMLELSSEKTYMSRFYLAYVLKQYEGVSSINYLTQLRVQQTEELLETTNYSTVQISDSCDFSSQSYSSQVFKKACGMTSNAYRKSNDRGKIVASDIAQPPML